MNIYVASSWRNNYQQEVVRALREAGHEVYDFRNPRPGDTGFHWSEIDPAWKCWNPHLFRQALKHPIAEVGFRSDMDALMAADLCVVVLPSGRSAHLEAGWAVGAGKPTFVFIPEACEPELMYKMCAGVCTDINDLLAQVDQVQAEVIERLRAEGHHVPRCEMCRGTGAEFPGNPRTEKCENCDGTGRAVEASA